MDITGLDRANTTLTKVIMINLSYQKCISDNN